MHVLGVPRWVNAQSQSGQDERDRVGRPSEIPQWLPFVFEVEQCLKGERAHGLIEVHGPMFGFGIEVPWARRRRSSSQCRTAKLRPASVRSSMTGLSPRSWIRRKPQTRRRRILPYQPGPNRLSCLRPTVLLLRHDQKIRPADDRQRNPIFAAMIFTAVGFAAMVPTRGPRH